MKVAGIRHTFRERPAPPVSPVRREIVRTEEELETGRKMVQEALRKRRKRGGGGRSGVSISRAQVDGLIADYKAGMVARDAAEKHGMSHTTALKYLKENGVATRGSKNSGHLADRMVELYGQGMGMREVGEIVGVSNATVRRQLMNKGVTIRSQGEWRRTRREQS